MRLELTTFKRKPAGDPIRVRASCKKASKLQLLISWSHPNRTFVEHSSLTVDDSLLLALNKNLVEWIVCDGVRETFDPLVFLIFISRWHPVDAVFAFNNLKWKLKRQSMLLQTQNWSNSPCPRNLFCKLWWFQLRHQRKAQSSAAYSYQ